MLFFFFDVPKTLFINLFLILDLSVHPVAFLFSSCSLLPLSILLASCNSYQKNSVLIVPSLVLLHVVLSSGNPY